MENVIKIQYYKSPVGELILGSYNDKLCLCDWRYRTKRKQIDYRIQKALNTSYLEEKSDVVTKTIQQLDEYFTTNRTSFTIPLLCIGSDFQKNVWQTLQTVPYGETISYLQLSEKLGNRKAIRAVAAANGANAISILIPCHRVIGQNGKLIGYAGSITTKKKLIALEKENSGKAFQTSMFLE